MDGFVLSIVSGTKCCNIKFQVSKSPLPAFHFNYLYLVRQLPYLPTW